MMGTRADVRRSRRRRVGLAICMATVVGLAGPPTVGAFTTFESGQVRPLALSPDGTRLFAVNTPDDRLEIFDVTAGGLAHARVGAGRPRAGRGGGRGRTARCGSSTTSPTASASSTSRSDPPRVVRTLLVGDEPRDIVFAGAGGSRAFITTAHRGQQRTNPSIAPCRARAIRSSPPRASAAPTSGCSTRPRSAARSAARRCAIVTLFGDTPRALAVSPDGNTVYAAIFKSGNQTTALSEGAVCNGFGVRRDLRRRSGHDDARRAAAAGAPTRTARTRPETGLIVKFDQAIGPVARRARPQLDAGGALRPARPGRVRHRRRRRSAQTAVLRARRHDALQHGRQPGERRASTCRTPTRATRSASRARASSAAAPCRAISPNRASPSSTGPASSPRHLNKHIDYDERAGPAGDQGPQPGDAGRHGGLAATARRSTSPRSARAKIGVFDTVALEDDTFDPTATSADYIAVSGGGPSGARARRGARSPLRADALRQRGLGGRPRAREAEIAHLAAAQPRAGRASSTAGRSSTTP